MDTRFARRLYCCAVFQVAVLVAVHSGREVRAETSLETDLLIVGGTESACAAAVQAARMGVSRITLVNDIEWLGGQFSAEALAAIDENTDKTGVRHDPPIPRHGAFQEIIERIEAGNLEKYGVARPGNTRVITTTRPADAERVFREWLAPYVDRGQVALHARYEPVRVQLDGSRVTGVTFRRRKDGHTLRVRAKLTIDASDWGDVIRLSGGGYEFGPDLKSRYAEPLAPESRADYPRTDMNPITYCMVIVETDGDARIPRPHGYDPRNYRRHRYPKDPLWLYGTRRLVDHYHFPVIDHPDVLLLCFPAFDYPLDVLPQAVADALENMQPGASKKNIVEMTPAQRRIVFEDAKRYSLGFLYYLQTEVHDRMPDKTHSFRRFKLTGEFGTPDELPFKPYVRESLRMKAMYMMRQQDTTGVGGDSANFARAMYHDGVAVWQFEYDFHPTRREFLDEGDRGGPWRNAFREGRTWGPPYSGRSLFPLRSLIPEQRDGLLGGQKNLGFSSIVSAAVRLHDQSMAVGQAAGACAAFCILRGLQPREIPFHRERLMALQQAIASPHDGGRPGMLWPFRDLQSTDPAFTAVNLLAVQGCLPLRGDEVAFRPDQPAAPGWIEQVVRRTRRQLQPSHAVPDPPRGPLSRGQFARQWWALVRDREWNPYVRRTAVDADGDGRQDRDDALPLDPDNASLPLRPLPPDSDGVPGALPAGWKIVKQVNFAGPSAPLVERYEADHGVPYSNERGYGWNRDISRHHRRRGRTGPLSDTFLFTRSHDVWQCAVPEGEYLVELSVGDSAYEQFGQHVTVEGEPVLHNHTTRIGRFAEKRVHVRVRDGKLTVEIGRPGSDTNTCLNWIRIAVRE